MFGGGSEQEDSRRVDTTLFGSARQQVSLTGPDTEKLSAFLRSAASNDVLLSGERISPLHHELEAVKFMHFAVVPVVSLGIERHHEADELVVRIDDGRVRLNGRLSRSSSIEGTNTVRWRNIGDGQWSIETDIDLTLKLRIPWMPRPALRAWQATGSAVLSAACKRNARRLLRDVSEAHAAWEPPA